MSQYIHIIFQAFIVFQVVTSFPLYSSYLKNFLLLYQDIRYIRVFVNRCEVCILLLLLLHTGGLVCTVYGQLTCHYGWERPCNFMDYWSNYLLLPDQQLSYKVEKPSKMYFLSGRATKVLTPPTPLRLETSLIFIIGLK